eukprot:CAMPEP_0171883748 /NCGR_PEP_ID=MMETSP0992-20121227/40352_1 /TAXON_ID=483369 /ORGANISM="non described non described, Strain CCMP2098" /LENGTH=153 /DNA_ID=CAMNT_0012509999 /DNA_START=220 /DNA_END=682 /DNA_ORIENTATION=+
MFSGSQHPEMAAVVVLLSLWGWRLLQFGKPISGNVQIGVVIAGIVKGDTAVLAIAAVLEPSLSSWLPPPKLPLLLSGSGDDEEGFMRLRLGTEMQAGNPYFLSASKLLSALLLPPPPPCACCLFGSWDDDNGGGDHGGVGPATAACLSTPTTG